MSKNTVFLATRRAIHLSKKRKKFNQTNRSEIKKQAQITGNNKRSTQPQLTNIIFPSPKPMNQPNYIL
jgi:hypothetical protein